MMWASAYLEQARSDWNTRQVVSENGCAGCQDLHYLQMATEKLAKAALLRSGNPLDSVTNSHKAFVSLLRVASRNPSLRQTLGFTARQLQAYVKGIEPVAYKIERLAPAVAQKGPNTEYPWETPLQEVAVPASFDFPVLKELRGPQGRKLLKLVRVMLRDFDVFF